MKCKGRCPSCNSEEIEYGALELDGEQCYYSFICDDCDYIGKEWYCLEYAETV